MIALIDADEILYRIALKYQKQWYLIKKDDKVLWKYPYKEDAVESVGNRNDLEIEPYIEVLEPIGYKKDFDFYISRILLLTGAIDYKLYLSGSDNFRKKLATLLPYKGNRKDKPFHIELVREEAQWRGAESVPFLEGDDLLSAYNSILPEDTIICSTDKDLRTVPSLNFNTTTSKISDIDEHTARYNFWCQMMIGDSTDNIPSPYGLGEVATKRALGTLYGNSDYEYFSAIKKFYCQYLHGKDKEGSYKSKWYSGQDVEDILWEVGNLIWMHRTLDEDERWKLPI